jgi:redox-sensitive bicupin YhaK (pirin superfamily)
MWWNFVGRSRAQIDAAYASWAAHRIGTSDR